MSSIALAAARCCLASSPLPCRTRTRARALSQRNSHRSLSAGVQVGLAQRGEVAALVPLKGIVGVTRFEINAREFIGRARRIGKLLGGVLQIECLLLVFCRLVGIALEGIGDGHRAQRLNLRSRRRFLNRLGQMLARLLVLALQIQSHSRRQVCLEEIWR